MRIFANANYDFLGMRRRGYLISGVLLALGIGAMVYNTVAHGSWLNYGIDFTGGSVVQVEFNEPTSVDQIRSAAGPGWQITRFGTDSEFIIRMPTFDQETGRDAAQVVTAELTPDFGEGAFQVVRTEAVGPTVGAELQRNALYAILISILATLIYLAIRFEWRFGIAASVATAHDVIVPLGLLAIMQTEIAVGTVAALLTIIGYSLNDTIIIFDRIRENLQTPKKTATMREVINRSINETLPRTVLTSVTTLATLVSLYLFGGSVIRDFALVLILGIVIGTFSSIFIASAALYWIQNRWPRKPQRAGSRTPAAARARTARAAV